MCWNSQYRTPQTVSEMHVIIVQLVNVTSDSHLARTSIWNESVATCTTVQIRLFWLFLPCVHKISNISTSGLKYNVRYRLCTVDPICYKREKDFGTHYISKTTFVKFPLCMHNMNYIQLPVKNDVRFAFSGSVHPISYYGKKFWHSSMKIKTIADFVNFCADFVNFLAINCN